MCHPTGHDHPRAIIALCVGLALLVLSALACNAPSDPAPPPVAEAPPAQTEQAEPEEEAAPPEEEAGAAEEVESPPEPAPVAQPDVVYEGISFSYDPSIAAGVQGETFAAEGGAGGPEWDIAPQRVRFEFAGYALPDTYHKPVIILYQAEEYAAMSETAAATIADLRDLLEQKPPSPEEIPFLPMWNAAQFLQASVAYFDFQNGAGVRFLTQYGQDANPVNNHDMFYAFQGLTHDGSTYVAGIFPASNPILPADGSEIPGGDYNAFADDFRGYLDDMEGQLSAQPASSFTPDLSLLDQMIQSLLVE